MFPVSQSPQFRQTHGFIFAIVWIVFAAIVWCGIVMPIMERRFPLQRNDTHTDGDGDGDNEPGLPVQSAKGKEAPAAT